VICEKAAVAVALLEPCSGGEKWVLEFHPPEESQPPRFYCTPGRSFLDLKTSGPLGRWRGCEEKE